MALIKKQLKQATVFSRAKILQEKAKERLHLNKAFSIERNGYIKAYTSISCNIHICVIKTSLYVEV